MRPDLASRWRITNCDLKAQSDVKIQHCVVIDIDEQIVERNVKVNMGLRHKKIFTEKGLFLHNLCAFV